MWFQNIKIGGMDVYMADNLVFVTNHEKNASSIFYVKLALHNKVKRDTGPQFVKLNVSCHCCLVLSASY